jgi:hypothetical protein
MIIRKAERLQAIEFGPITRRSILGFRAKWAPVRVKKTRQNKNLQ